MRRFLHSFRDPTRNALPHRQRHLTALILRKLLASSPEAIADEELLEEIVGTDDDENTSETDRSEVSDRKAIEAEIFELRRLATWAHSMRTDTKARALLRALEIGFDQMESLGAQRKALIFTESRRTQEYLKAFLEANGYAGQVVVFNRTNSGPEATRIYEAWREKNADSGRVSESRAID